MIGGGGGGNTDRMAEGHCEGECAGGEAETTSILQSEWEAKSSSSTRGRRGRGIFLGVNKA